MYTNKKKFKKLNENLGFGFIEVLISLSMIVVVLLSAVKLTEIHYERVVDSEVRVRALNLAQAKIEEFKSKNNIEEAAIGNKTLFAEPFTNFKYELSLNGASLPLVNGGTYLVGVKVFYNQAGQDKLEADLSGEIQIATP